MDFSFFFGSTGMFLGHWGVFRLVWFGLVWFGLVSGLIIFQNNQFFVWPWSSFRHCSFSRSSFPSIAVFVIVSFPLASFFVYFFVDTIAAAIVRYYFLVLFESKFCEVGLMLDSV